MNRYNIVKSLDKKQIKTIYNNLLKVRGLYNNKLINDDMVIDPENSNITRYELYSSKSNVDRHVEYFILIYHEGKFDKNKFKICESFYEQHLSKDTKLDNRKAPNVTILLTFPVMSKTYTRTTTTDKILPCKYRILLINELIGILGSKEIFGLSYDYCILDDYKHSTNKRFPIIYDTDPIIKILNGVEGQFLKYHRIINDKSVYSEICVRKIKTKQHISKREKKVSNEKFCILDDNSEENKSEFDDEIDVIEEIDEEEMNEEEDNDEDISTESETQDEIEEIVIEEE